MRLYLCGRSALSVLRYLRSIHDERLFRRPSRIRSLTQAVRLRSQLTSLSFEAEYLVGHAGDTVHALVPSQELHGSRDGFTAHLWSASVPSGAFLRLADDLFVSSPAFVFLHMARELEPFELAMLGLELCGFYSLPECRVPFVSKSIDETEYEIPAVTTARRIRALCDAAPAAHGVERARMVSRWLADCSASPMESIVFLLLTLSRHWGGYAVPAPVFNPKVVVKTARGVESRYPDLYWHDASIDVEYQSDFAHTGAWKRYKDSKRHIQLTVNKITVLPLTKIQVEDASDFHEFALGLRKLLRMRNRRFDRSWEVRRDELRRSLLAF